MVTKSVDSQNTNKGTQFTAMKKVGVYQQMLAQTVYQLPSQVARPTLRSVGEPDYHLPHFVQRFASAQPTLLHFFFIGMCCYKLTIFSSTLRPAF